MFVVMEKSWSYDWENYDLVFANKSEKICVEYINENGGYEFTETFKSGEAITNMK